MGNGPSLANDLKRHGDVLRNNTVCCVNTFATSQHFVDLRPDFYFLMDPAYSRRTVCIDEKVLQNAVFSSINEKTDWDMHVFFPVYPDQVLLENIFVSDRVHIHMCNLFPALDWRGVRNYIYRTGVLLPPVQNVLNAAIFACINMGFKEIYLIGADHSWTRNIRVRDDNVLCKSDEHFDGTTPMQPWHIPGRIDAVTFKVHELFGAFSRAFRAYWILADYANYRGVRVYNCTQGSFIDAFERRSIADAGRNAST